MGSIYSRKDSKYLWMKWQSVGGTWESDSTKTTDRAEAEAMLAEIEREVAAKRKAGFVLEGPLTFWRYVDKSWSKKRHELEKANAKREHQELKRHAKPLHNIPLIDVTRDDIVSLIRQLMRSELAPRYILNIYGSIRLVFRDAVIEGHVKGTPCTLRADRGELPNNEDKDPLWRDTAVFSRQEVETLISSSLVAPRERVLYGLLFLTGMRVGEAVARRWRDYDTTMQPLGRLLIATSFSEKRRKEGKTKTKKAKTAPVHPTLARLLAEWKLGGWEQLEGRAPGPDDLIIPPGPEHRYGGRRQEMPDGQPYFRPPTQVHKQLQDDCAELGFRKRRVHDCRATFKTLTEDDGCREEIIQKITHPPKTDVVSLYKRVVWTTLCAEISKLNITIREGEVVELRRDQATPGYSTK